VEVVMSLDKIIVLALAIAFGGVFAFMFWKGRQTEQKAGHAPSPAASESVEENSLKSSQGKRQKNLKQ
jgi:hypothetical protein